MSKITFPFGPQHPVLPEAIQLSLTCEDEKVVEVLPVIGYMHRGIEKAAERNPYVNNVFLCERICGICSFIHALSYCQLVEALMQVEVPPRARYLRVVWSELSRMHSHLLWLGLLADSFGFESLFMQCWRARETVLDALEMTTGQRVIQSSCVVGGVRRDINADQARQLREMLAKVKTQIDAVLPVFQKDYTIKARTVGKGILPKDQAWKLGAVGPTLRASGWAWDCRSLGYAAYGELGFEPVVENDGDSYARTMVRARELVQSYELVLRALDALPEGPLAAKIKGVPPKGEAIMRTEQPRGELFEYARGNGTPRLERLRVRTPTFANIPALLATLPGCEIADVPVIVLSIDPCVACLER
jgi:ech hydrogenase subunit E